MVICVSAPAATLEPKQEPISCTKEHWATELYFGSVMNDTSRQTADEDASDHRRSAASALPPWPSVALGFVYLSLLAIAYIFGLFEMIGPGLLQSVDKIGLFGHLAFYGGLYAVVSLLLTAFALLLLVIVFLVFMLFFELSSACFCLL